MTQRTLENLTHRYIDARNRADPSAIWPWVALFVACFTAAGTPEGTNRIFNIEPRDLDGLYRAGMFGSAFMSLRIGWGLGASWLYNRDATRNDPGAQSRRLKNLRVNCPPDWVPTNPKAYAQYAVEEITRESSETGITRAAPPTSGTSSSPTGGAR